MYCTCDPGGSQLENRRKWEETKIFHYLKFFIEKCLTNAKKTCILESQKGKRKGSRSPQKKGRLKKLHKCSFPKSEFVLSFIWLWDSFRQYAFPRGKVEPKEKSRKGKDKAEKKRRKRAGKLHKGIWQKGNRFKGNAFEGSGEKSTRKVFGRKAFGRREALKESFSGSGKRKILQRISHFSN